MAVWKIKMKRLTSSTLSCRHFGKNILFVEKDVGEGRTGQTAAGESRLWKAFPSKPSYLRAERLTNRLLR